METEELIKRFEPVIKTIAGQYGGAARRDVEWDDLVSVGYMTVLENAGKWDASAGMPFDRFMKMLIRYRIIDVVRRGKDKNTWKTWEVAWNEWDGEDCRKEWVEESEGIERGVLVGELLGELDGRTRDVVVRYLWQEDYFWEIGARYGKSESWAYTEYKKGLQKLYRCLLFDRERSVIVK